MCYAFTIADHRYACVFENHVPFLTRAAFSDKYELGLKLQDHHVKSFGAEELSLYRSCK